MVWRHSSAAINDPRPTAGSFSMADVRRLSAHVIKMRGMPEAVLVLSGLSRVWKSCVCDPVLRDADGNVIGIHDFLCLPEWTDAEVQEEPHLDDLAIGTHSFKILAKAEASHKPKASTSGATSSHVAKRTRSALAQSSGSTTRPSLFVGDSDDESDGDDDACVEILLVTPIRSAVVIHSSGTRGGSSFAPTAEDSRGKGIMANDAAAPFVGVSRPRPSSGHVPSFRDVSGDAIHAYFFPFSTGPYYATYPEGGVAGNCEFTCEDVVRGQYHNKLPFNSSSLKLSPDHFIIASTNNTKPDLYAEYLSKTDTTNDADVFAAINDSLSALVCNTDTAISNALNTFQLSSKGLNDEIDASLNKVKMSFNTTLSGFGNNSKGVSSKAGAIAVDGLRQSIVAVEQILVQGGTLVVYAYSSLKDMLPPNLHDLLDSTEQTLRPVGTTLRQVYIVLEGFEANLGIDPTDPIVPFLLLIGTSTTLWVSYWILTYAGYAGDLSPQLTFELLNNGKERVALIDVDSNVKKLLKSGKDLDDALVAAVIRNLKVVQ
nr:rhodanese-like domain-containing protein [Tanacetum cinerariifolium]